MSRASLVSLLPKRLESSDGFGFEVTRWSLVAFFVGLVFIPHIVAPSLVRVDRSMIRAGIMLAEVAVMLVWSLTPKTTTYVSPIHRGWWVVGSVWVTSVLIATSSAVHVAPAVLRTTEWLSHGLFATVLWLEFQRDPEALAATVWAIPTGFVALVVATVWFAFQLPDPAQYDWVKGIPYLGNVRRLGMYALAGIAFSSPAFLTPGSSRRARGWAWAGLTLSWAVLFWGGGRGSFGAGCLVAGCIWALAKGHRDLVLKAFASSVLVGALLSLCFPVDNTSMGLWRMFLRMEEGAGADHYSSGRITFWQTSLAAWQERPWFGYGPDATAFVLAPFGHVQPHNFVVQALVEWGLVGAVAFIVLLGGAIATAARRVLLENHPVLRARRAVATSYLVGMTGLALLDGVFYHARPLALVAASAAIALLPSGLGKERQVAVRREVRLGLRGLALVVLLVVIAHVVTVQAVWKPGVPAPGSARVALVRAFPSTASLWETAAWLKAWAPGDPEGARDWAQWGRRHAFLPWKYLRLEADLLLQQGEIEEAEALFAEADLVEAASMRFR